MEFGLEVGASAVTEFAPAAVLVVSLVAGVGLLGFLAWKTLLRGAGRKIID
ncbi:MAG TPA: hypothetical protein VNZ85_04430 [Caulobacter sp.]|nr:hypothetical protein [Caulobacter sp.]